MLRDNVVRILVLAETALIEGDGPTSGEKRIPKLLLQFLNLSLKICDEGCLFLESRRSDQVISVKVQLLLGTLEELDACMVVERMNLASDA
jgi:hypothetical protein